MNKFNLQLLQLWQIVKGMLVDLLDAILVEVPIEKKGEKNNMEINQKIRHAGRPCELLINHGG
jgi:hypothetical protein